MSDKQLPPGCFFMENELGGLCFHSNRFTESRAGTFILETNRYRDDKLTLPTRYLILQLRSDKVPINLR